MVTFNCIITGLLLLLLLISVQNLQRSVGTSNLQEKWCMQAQRCMQCGVCIRTRVDVVYTIL